MTEIEELKWRVSVDRVRGVIEDGGMRWALFLDDQGVPKTLIQYGPSRDNILWRMPLGSPSRSRDNVKRITIGFLNDLGVDAGTVRDEGVEIRGLVSGKYELAYTEIAEGTFTNTTRIVPIPSGVDIPWPELDSMGFEFRP